MTAEEDRSEAPGLMRYLLGSLFWLAWIWVCLITAFLAESAILTALRSATPTGVAFVAVEVVVYAIVGTAGGWVGDRLAVRFDLLGPNWWTPSVTAAAAVVVASTMRRAAPDVSFVGHFALQSVASVVPVLVGQALSVRRGRRAHVSENVAESSSRE